VKTSYISVNIMSQEGDIYRHSFLNANKNRELQCGVGEVQNNKQTDLHLTSER
jgi:hypothetical protein